MRRAVRPLAIALAATYAAGVVLIARQQPAQAGPEARAVAYLSDEVPRWRREHPCYSCHNNGDATRALLAAAARGHALGGAVDDTLSWLAAPERWDQNALRGGSEDLPLARIQFASALLSMVEAGRAGGDALERAAALVSAHQQPDGSWQLNPSQILGGATFYGRALATAMARRTLARASSAGAKASLARADTWLRSFEVATVLDASSVLIGLDGADDGAAADQRARCLQLLKEGQGPDGGWGPYVTSPSEVFDTALAVLALSGVSESEAAGVYSGAELRDAVRGGREFLVSAQADDGSWLETTRPSGGESYAQRISTTAWALLALLAAR
jgi:squalene cyclase